MWYPPVPSQLKMRLGETKAPQICSKPLQISSSLYKGGGTLCAGSALALVVFGAAVPLWHLASVLFYFTYMNHFLSFHISSVPSILFPIMFLLLNSFYFHFSFLFCNNFIAISTSLIIYTKNVFSY